MANIDSKSSPPEDEDEYKDSKGKYALKNIISAAKVENWEERKYFRQINNPFNRQLCIN